MDPIGAEGSGKVFRKSCASNVPSIAHHFALMTSQLRKVVTRTSDSGNVTGEF